MCDGLAAERNHDSPPPTNHSGQLLFIEVHVEFPHGPSLRPGDSHQRVHIARHPTAASEPLNGAADHALCGAHMGLQGGQVGLHVVGGQRGGEGLGGLDQGAAVAAVQTRIAIEEVIWAQGWSAGWGV